MRAVVHDRDGPLEMLRLEEAERPTPKSPSPTCSRSRRRGRVRPSTRQSSSIAFADYAPGFSPGVLEARHGKRSIASARLSRF